MASYDVIVKLVDQTKTGLRNIESGLTTIQSRAEQVNKTLDRLGAGLNKAGVVAGAALGVAARSAIAYADAIQDASNASGIATGTILAFSQGVATSGGEASRAVDAMVRFADAVGTAATGSYESRKAFDAVGISLQDLRTLSEEDLFKKTIQGLAGINDLSLRAAAQNNIFGKTLKGVDIGGFAGDLEAAAAAQQKNAEAIKSAAAVVDQLKIGYGKLEIAILKALKPLSDWIGKISQDQMDRFVEAILNLGSAILALTAGLKVFQGIVAILGTLAGSIALVSGGFARLAANALTVSNLFTTFGSLLTAPLVAGTSILARFTLGWLVLKATLAAILAPVGAIALGVAQIAAVAASAAFAIDALFDTKIVETFTNAVKSAWSSITKFFSGGKDSAPTFLPQEEVDNEIKRLQALSKAREQATPKPDPNIEGLVDQLKKAGEEYASFYAVAKSKDLNLASLAFAGLSAAAEKLGKVAIKPTALILRDFNLELSKQEEALNREKIELGNAAAQARAFDIELVKGAQELDKQNIRLKDLERTTQLWSQSIEKTVLDLEEQNLKLANAGIQQRIYANEIAQMNIQLKDQQQRMADANLQQSIYSNELAKGALALKDQEQRLGNIALQQGLFDQSIQKTRNDLDQQKVTLELLNEAYSKGVISLDEYANALGGINTQLLGSRQLMAQALNDANKEVKTAALRKQAIQDLITQYKAAGGTGTEAFKKAAEALGAQTPQIQSVVNQYGSYADKVKEYNQDVEDSINSASKTFVDEFTTAFMKGENMLDSFRNFFSNVMNDIAQRIIKKQLTEPIADALNGMVNDLMKSSGGIGSILGNIFSGGGGGAGGGSGGLLSGIGGFLGDAWSSITSFFGYANGGMIGAGQVGIVGENGPEYITGPANITPMDQAGQTVTPNVMFTINAIDTQTGVQFLLQNKPAIVNMVSEAYNKRGRRGVNG